jgi:hypothetical protein
VLHRLCEVHTPRNVTELLDTMSRIIYQIFDYVIRRFNAPSADLKADWIFAETPLSAISRFNWSPESPEVRPLLKGPHEDGSSFRADLE